MLKGPLRARPAKECLFIPSPPRPPTHRRPPRHSFPAHRGWLPPESHRFLTPLPHAKMCCSLTSASRQPPSDHGWEESTFRRPVVNASPSAAAAMRDEEARLLLGERGRVDGSCRSCVRDGVLASRDKPAPHRFARVNPSPGRSDAFGAGKVSDGIKRRRFSPANQRVWRRRKWKSASRKSCSTWKPSPLRPPPPRQKPFTGERAMPAAP